MNKSLFLTLAWFLSLLSLVAQDQLFTIQVSTHDVPDHTIVYLVDPSQNIHVDSTVVMDNHFVFEGEVQDYNRYVLFLRYNDTYDYKYLYIQPGRTEVDARQSSLHNGKAVGGAYQWQSEELQRLLESSNEDIDRVNQEIYGSQNISVSTKDSLIQLKAEAHRLQKRIAKRFIQQYPDSPVSSSHLTFLKNSIGKKESKGLFELLSNRQKESDDGKYILNWMLHSVTLEVGDEAPDFILPNLASEAISLSQFKGKLVLLEFGATGCYPCRLENPVLLKAYNNYKNEGFEILSVWLDHQITSWRRTVEQDTMIWTTVSDLKGDHGEVPTLYNVTYIPKNYLLDREGRVLAKDVRGAELESTLAGILQNEED